MKQTKKELRSEIEELHEDLGKCLNQLLEACLVMTIMVGEITLAQQCMKQTIKYIDDAVKPNHTFVPDKIKESMQTALNEMNELSERIREVHNGA